jgi:hypothetical protein
MPHNGLSRDAQRFLVRVRMKPLHGGNRAVRPEQAQAIRRHAY